MFFPFKKKSEQASQVCLPCSLALLVGVLCPADPFLNTLPLPTRNEPMASSSPLQRIPDQLCSWWVCLVPWWWWWFHGHLHMSKFRLCTLPACSFGLSIIAQQNLKTCRSQGLSGDYGVYISNCVFLGVPSLIFSFDSLLHLTCKLIFQTQNLSFLSLSADHDIKLQ